jgi:hypothetical protein
MEVWITTRFDFKKLSDVRATKTPRLKAPQSPKEEIK